MEARTTITLAHAVFEKGDVVFYDGKPYVVVRADHDSCTVTVRPVRGWVYWVLPVAMVLFMIAMTAIWYSKFT